MDFVQRLSHRHSLSAYFVFGQIYLALCRFLSVPLDFMGSPRGQIGTLCIESTLPGTDIPCYENWENIILNRNYIFASQLGVNRYYVAREHENLRDRFLSREEYLMTYRIFHAELILY